MSKFKPFTSKHALTSFLCGVSIFIILNLYNYWLTFSSYKPQDEICKNYALHSFLIKYSDNENFPDLSDYTMEKKLINLNADKNDFVNNPKIKKVLDSLRINFKIYNSKHIPYFYYYLSSYSTTEIDDEKDNNNIKIIPVREIEMEAIMLGLKIDYHFSEIYKGAKYSYKFYKQGKWNGNNGSKYKLPGPRNIYNDDPRFPDYDPDEQFNYPLFPIQGYNKNNDIPDNVLKSPKFFEYKNDFNTKRNSLTRNFKTRAEVLDSARKVNQKIIKLNTEISNFEDKKISFYAIIIISLISFFLSALIIFFKGYKN